ncbi:MAG: PAS domain S-box protein [Patescibacteria group bacterium]|nr:PAS domain S-box protein [Patescibacteria group bacterium]
MDGQGGKMKDPIVDFRDFVERLNSQIFWEIKLPEFNWVYVSPSVEKLRGYTVEEAMKQPLEEILTKESFQVVVKKLENDLERKTTEKDHQFLKLEHFCKDGSTRWFSVEISVSRNEKGVSTKIIGISHDIDDVENQLLNQKRKIEQLEGIAQKIKGLKEIIPICASCKKIRGEDDKWEQVEAYISRNYPINFSHGMCKPCSKKLYPEIYDKMYPEG